MKNCALSNKEHTKKPSNTLVQSEISKKWSEESVLIIYVLTAVFWLNKTYIWQHIILYIMQINHKVTF